MEIENLTRLANLIDYISRYAGCSKADIFYRFSDGERSFSDRTFERMKDQAPSFGYRINYDRKLGGYFVEEIEGSVVKDLFSRLLESVSEYEFFTEALKSDEGSQRILFEYNKSPRFYQYLPEIFKAIQGRKVVQFSYTFFHDGQTMDHLEAQPLFLKEYLSRWYVIAYSDHKKALRSYGLDRITNLVRSEETFDRKKLGKFANPEAVRKLFSDAVGLTYEGDLINLVLKFTDQQARYIESLPIHESQEYVKSEDGWNYYRYKVIWNFELEQKILMQGEQAVVVEPEVFRDFFYKRVEAMLDNR